MKKYPRDDPHFLPWIVFELRHINYWLECMGIDSVEAKDVFWKEVHAPLVNLKAEDA